MTRPLGAPETRRLLDGLRAGAAGQRLSALLRPRGAASNTAEAPETILLGMPQLALGGLSENWLLKDCGHRHWLLLARAAGRPVPDFRDGDERPVYAAFNAVSVTGDLGRARENDVLTVRAALVRVSRTQFMSRQIFCRDGEPIATVTMVSVFVHRTEDGRNRSIARLELPGFAEPVADDSGLVRRAAAIRSGGFGAHMGFAAAEAGEIARLGVDPCPSLDFNGADFLYFASFQAFADRAEWQQFRDPARRLATRRRDLVFRGNIEPGETLQVVIAAARETTDGIAHWCRVYRTGDMAPIAEIFTEKVG